MTRLARGVLAGTIAVLVFAGSWFLRFNDPGGSFAGLTDDHFFYLVRGWQILFGDLPVRDFVDHGAPLYYYIAAGVQQVLGRGTLSELEFSVTVLAFAAVMTWWLAARASGSLALGLLGVLVHILLEPRFYNYPKILVYAVGIPLLWRFAEKPAPWPRGWLAAWTVVAFLFRHDHGVFMGIAVVTLLAVMTDLPWRERARHAAVYIGLTALLAAPYLLFIEFHGGLDRYFDDAASWAAKDRNRAPVVWPGLFDNPGGVRDNLTAWMYYLELVLPLIALALIGTSRDAFRPAWPRAAAKLTVVAVLGIALNAGFLRSPLGARLADPSVPHAILIAWLAAAAFALLRSRESLKPALRPYAVPVRVLSCVALLPVAFVLAVALTTDVVRRLEKARLTEGLSGALERSSDVSRQLRNDWRLVTWVNREERPDLMNLVLYLDACTEPGDRIFVQPYIPQVLALSRRAFAGGHADLRPGFFTSPAAQELTLERLKRQPVPVALLEMDDEYRNFRKAFPLIAEYFDREYVLGGTRVFDNRFGVQLFVRRDLVQRRQDAVLGWPCFR